MPADSTGALLGGDCAFLGFPYGGGWRAETSFGHPFWLPFIKHCTISGNPNDDPKNNKRIWVLDGINNEGFSGCPVIFGTGAQQKILGVISGHHTEPAEVIYSMPASPPPKATVEVNSGFILAFDIIKAIEAIHKNPIGPLRKQN